MNVSWKGRPGTDPELRYSHAIPGIHAALDSGITLLDTADVYAPTYDQMGHNELLVKEALDSWQGPQSVRDALVLATKGGITRSEGEVWGRNGSLDYLVSAAEKSIARLGVDSIQLYQHHRLDPSMDLETQIENLGELKKRGLVQQLGVSNYNKEQLEVAIDILGGPSDGGVISVQNEFSVFYRHDLDVLDLCEEHGVAVFPWSPLGSASRAQSLLAGDIPVMSEIAASHGVSEPQIALAWLLHYSPAIIALPGATRPETVRDSVAASDVALSAEEMSAISAALPESAPRAEALDPAPPRR